MLNAKQVRYLLAGGWNTLFGYGMGVSLYYGLTQYLHTVVIAVISNVFAITMSFITYKTFVFKTKGNWLHEYLRSCMVYAGIALISVVLLWLLVDGMHIKIWLAQGIIILATVAVSYIGHARFTFRRNPEYLRDKTNV